MIPVSEIWDEAVELAGTCEEAIVYKRINRAVEILANKSDWDPLVGFMDITADDRIVTLPREIETPLSVSYGNYPALGRDKLFRYHLNGPADRCSDCACTWRFWEDGFDAVTFRELCPAAVVAAIACVASDVGKTVTVYGFDTDGKEVRTLVDGAFVNGYPITLQALAGFVPDPLAPTFSRITRVSKELTNDQVELWTVVDDAVDTLTAIYAWDDTEPVFRRLRIDRDSADLVRIYYRKRNFKVRAQTDLIPLHSAEAIFMMMQALKFYRESDFANGTASEATAVRWLTEEQWSRNPNIMTPIQVAGPPVEDDDIN